MKRSALHIHPSRLWTAPEIRTIERILDGSPGCTTFAIDGLVCGLCADRTRDALTGVGGVHGVQVDLERGVAVVEHEGDAPGLAALQGALDRAVVARPLRKLLDRLAHPRRPRSGRATAR